jgi:hypothetical protein
MLNSEEMSITFEILRSKVQRSYFMAMYGLDIPSLGKEVLGKIFGAAASSCNATCIFSCSFR